MFIWKAMEISCYEKKKKTEANFSSTLDLKVNLCTYNDDHTDRAEETPDERILQV